MVSRVPPAGVSGASSSKVYRVLKADDKEAHGTGTRCRRRDPGPRVHRSDDTEVISVRSDRGAPRHDTVQDLADDPPEIADRERKLAFPIDAFARPRELLDSIRERLLAGGVDQPGGGLGASLAPPLSFPQECFDIGPERPPRLLFGLWELCQGLGIAEAGQVGVDLPVLESLDDDWSGFHYVGVEQPSPGGQLGLEPTSGLSAEPGFRGVVQRPLVLARSGSGKCRHAGGVVAMLSLAVIRQLRSGCQRLGPEPGGCGELLPAEAQPGESQALDRVCRLVLTIQDCRQTSHQGDVLLKLLNSKWHFPCDPGGVRGDLSGPPVGCHGLLELALAFQGNPEVGVRPGVVGLELERFAVFSNGLVRLPLIVQGKTKIGVGHGVVGLEPERRAMFGY